MSFVFYSESMMNKMFDKSSNRESAKGNSHKSPLSLSSANTNSSNTDPIVLPGKPKMADDPVVHPGKSKMADDPIVHPGKSKMAATPVEEPDLDHSQIIDIKTQMETMLDKLDTTISKSLDTTPQVQTLILNGKEYEIVPIGDGRWISKNEYDLRKGLDKNGVTENAFNEDTIDANEVQDFSLKSNKNSDNNSDKDNNNQLQENITQTNTLSQSDKKESETVGNSNLKQNESETAGNVNWKQNESETVGNSKVKRKRTSSDNETDEEPPMKQQNLSKGDFSKIVTSSQKPETETKVESNGGANHAILKGLLV